MGYLAIGNAAPFNLLELQNESIDQALGSRNQR